MVELNENYLKLWQKIADDYNRTPAAVNDCPKCLGKGDIIVIDNDGYKALYLCSACFKRRSSLRLLIESGLDKQIEKLTIDSFETPKNYQKSLKQKALDYLANAKGEWFVALGQSGSGKTHICTAICGVLLKRGQSLRYFRWLNEGKKLKRLACDDEQYSSEIQQYLNCDVLYIDDLFKRKAGEPVTDADVKLAFELINTRIDALKITIISGEDNFNSLLKIDEATAGRIKQQAGQYFWQISQNSDYNYRLK